MLTESVFCASMNFSLTLASTTVKMVAAAVCQADAMSGVNCSPSPSAKTRANTPNNSCK
jgi:hypothetical protein